MAKDNKAAVSEADAVHDNAKLKKILIAAIILLTAAAIILGTVFSVKYFGTQHLVSKDGGGTLTNKRTGITYKLVVPCPYTVNIDFGEVYGELDGENCYKILYKDNDGVEKFYNPEKMIATVDEFKNVSLYLAQGFTLPKLEELNPTHGTAYYVEVEQILAGTLTSDAAQTITSLLKTREGTSSPVDIKTGEIMYLYLIDPSYPYFWYTVEYFETESGDRYVRDRSIGKCVKATEELTQIFGSQETETEQ